MPKSHTVFIVHGCSMYPVLKHGDQLLLRPARKEDLHEGDILVFTGKNGKKIVHRIVRTQPLQTRGDNCTADDLPVPENSPLFFVSARIRKGEKQMLTHGASGCAEFRKNQRKKKTKTLLKKMISPVLMLNPFKVPFSRLTHTPFKKGTVIYYAGKRPVGWYDGRGWHWMPRARFWVQNPTPKDLNEESGRQ